MGSGGLGSVGSGGDGPVRWELASEGLELAGEGGAGGCTVAAAAAAATKGCMGVVTMGFTVSGGGGPRINDRERGGGGGV